MICIKKQRFYSCPAAKVRRQGPPSSPRAQACICMHSCGVLIKMWNKIKIDGI